MEEIKRLKNLYGKLYKNYIVEELETTFEEILSYFNSNINGEKILDEILTSVKKIIDDFNNFKGQLEELIRILRRIFYCEYINSDIRILTIRLLGKCGNILSNDKKYQSNGNV